VPIHVTKLHSRWDEKWEDYVAQHSQGTFFHSLIWRDAVAQAFGHESFYLVALRDDRIVGLFPLARVKSRLAGTLLVSVPYAVYGGPLADDIDARDALIQHAKRLADRIHAQWLDIRSVEPQCPDLPVVKRYVTFKKPLPADPAQVLAEMPRKARAAARQARERYGLVAHFDDACLHTVWSLYSASMRRLASPNYPMEFFQSLIARTSPAGSVGDKPGHLVQLVTRKGQPIAGLISFVFRGTLIPYFAGYDARFEKYHPNNFLYLAAMEHGVQLGCREFDFGRSRLDNAGAYNFKRYQGFEPIPLHYQYYVPKHGRAPDLQPSNPRLTLARRVWPRLPLAVTRPLGAWLSRSIPG